jgi:predicted N-acetyltransferase YhbS
MSDIEKNAEVLMASSLEASDANPEDIRAMAHGLLASFVGDSRTEDTGDMPGEEVDTTVDQISTQMRGYLSDPDSVVACDGEKLVGLIGVEHHGKTKDGREILQLSRGNVNPEYRDAQIGSRMYVMVMENIAKKYPGAVIIGFSMQKSVYENLQAIGYKEISYEDYARLVGYDVDEFLSNTDRFKKDGYVALALPPEGWDMEANIPDKIVVPEVTEVTSLRSRAWGAVRSVVRSLRR